MPKVNNKSVLTKKAQVTIPKKIRKLLGLKPGDLVEFVVEQNGVKIIPLYLDLEENFGKVTPKENPEDFNKIRSSVEEQIAKETINKIY